MFVRLRFVIIRSFCISTVIILLLSVKQHFEQSTPKVISTESASRKENGFWKQIFEETFYLADTKRIEEIKNIQEEIPFDSANWTTIFSDIFQRKASKLIERNHRTSHKQVFQKDSSSFLPPTIEIYAETPVKHVFGQPKFCSSGQIFHPSCPYKNCRWNCEPAEKNSDQQRRAHIFHHVDIKADRMAAKTIDRTASEIWILWIDEANLQLQQLNQYQFNWTLSFRQDSEISVGSYGFLVNKFSKPSTLALQDSRLRQILDERRIAVGDIWLENRILTNFRLRRRHALWYVSNCQPKARLEYFQKLKQFYSIRAFGQCVDQQCQRGDACERNELYLAMFYLAFESQTCTDYITEKFWRAISHGLIPVVFGPDKKSYLDLNIPSSAFIHADDFSSAKALAEYLEEVGRNYYLYREYFQWLNNYVAFYDIDYLEPIRMCELCVKLNTQSLIEHSFYTDIHQWHQSGCSNESR